MRNVIILGTGGCAAQLTYYIEDNNSRVKEDDKIRILGYIEDEKSIDEYYNKYNYKSPVLCDIDGYEPRPNEEVLIAIMNIDLRIKMIDKLLKKKASIGSFFHGSVLISNDMDIGEGNIIFPYSMIFENAIIGKYNLLTSHSFISHDCVIGDNNFFSHAGIAGNVRIGNNNYFGIRSTVIPSIIMGDNNIIQAGMVVDKNLKDSTTYFYRFKEKVLAIPAKS
ncbi:acetyltransferase [Sediminicola arcticus]|uniref:Acetyltransferase n=1 Tax=Sediminicola arcticus TaxID=1574308 RepID=A0ABV2SVH8_9FLAO